MIERKAYRKSPGTKLTFCINRNIIIKKLLYSCGSRTFFYLPLNLLTSEGWEVVGSPCVLLPISRKTQSLLSSVCCSSYLNESAEVTDMKTCYMKNWQITLIPARRWILIKRYDKGHSVSIKGVNKITADFTNILCIRPTNPLSLTCLGGNHQWLLVCKNSQI